MKPGMSEHELLRRLAELPRSVPPAREAWPGISARISAEGSGQSAGRRRLPVWPLAAAASVLMVLAAGLLHEWQPAGQEGAERFAAIPPDGTVETQAAFLDTSLGSEMEYQAAFREFLAVSRAAVPAGISIEPIGRGWETLRQVELELRAALQLDPDNGFLLARMESLRAHQLELLQQIAALELASRRISI